MVKSKVGSLNGADGAGSNRCPVPGRRLRSGLALLLGLGWFVAAQPASAQTVVLTERAEVNSDSLRLGDIARIDPPGSDLASVPVGYAPYVGAHRWIRRGDLEVYLRRRGFDPASLRFQGADRVLVTRRSRLLEPDRILTAVTRFLRDLRPDVEFTVEGLQIPLEVVLPEGEVEVRIDASSRVGSLESVNLKVDFLVDSRVHRSQWVRARVTADAPVVVTARDLPFGHTLGGGDLVLEKRRLNRMEDFLWSLAEAAGQVTRRPLRAGSILTRRDLRQAELVRRGDVITLVAKGTDFSVTVQGRALDGGILGDRITVENLASRQTVQARIIAEGRARVLLASDQR